MTVELSDIYLNRVFGYDNRIGPTARGKPLARGKPADIKIRGNPQEVEVQKTSVFASNNTVCLVGFWNLKGKFLAQTEAPPGKEKNRSLIYSTQKNGSARTRERRYLQLVVFDGY